MKSVVLLNDTSFENHHGCNIVVENIKRNLLAQAAIDYIKDTHSVDHFISSKTIVYIIISRNETIHYRIKKNMVKPKTPKYGRVMRRIIKNFTVAASKFLTM